MANPYPGGFLDLLAATPGPALDCGAGGRTHPAMIGMEYVAHPHNSVQGDGLNLPFRDGTFGLVLSQAVLEHVTDPQRYIDECTRVLRPGGLLWIEAAFLQPVHQAPWHFFNVTPFGLAHLCQHLEVERQEQFGALSDTVEWMCREAGAAVVLRPGEMATVRRIIDRLDVATTPERRWNTASGVRIVGRKR